MLRNKILYSVFLISVIAVSGCATSPVATAPQEQLEVASFNYDPPVTNPAGSAGMNIILVSPKYAQNFKYSGTEPYQSFARNMAADFEEVLTSRGYTVQGPYASYDEIVFSVKEKADLILATDIDIVQNDAGLTKRQERDFMSALIISTAGAQPVPFYKISGSIGLSGKVTFKAYEPQTKEKMWVKSVNIDTIQVPVSSNKAWRYDAVQTGGFYNDPGIHNPTLKALRKVYVNALEQAYTYLEPKELQQLRPQILRIKEGVRY